MNKIYLANLSDRGFLKLHYYIEEEISTEFLNPLGKYTPIDGWINGILIEISNHLWQYETEDIDTLCNDIFLVISQEKEAPKPFYRAIDYIKKNDLIQWTEQK